MIYEYMPVDPPWRPPMRVLVSPVSALPLYGDPRALSAAAALRARQRTEGDPFEAPARVPVVINRECKPSEGPGKLPRLHQRAVERGWQARVTHGRGWGISRYGPGHKLVDSYALRLRGTRDDGADVRMFGLWVNGQAQHGGFLIVGSVPVRIGIEQLGELINSVRIG